MTADPPGPSPDEAPRPGGSRGPGCGPGAPRGGRAVTSRAGLVVVGGGTAGLAAARGYREHGGEGRVVVLTEEHDAPYFRPSLSKELLRGEQEPAELALVGEGWWADHEVQLRRATSVSALEPEQGAVCLADGTRWTAGAIVLCPGAAPVVPDIPGVEHPEVLALRSLRSALALRERAGRARSAVVVGSGFIGCEAAVSLALRGLDVTLVSDEIAPHADRLGEVVGQRIAGWLREHGVRLELGAAVEAIEDGRRVRAGGSEHAADLVLLGLGARPEAALAEQAGLDTADGRIVVDAHMCTSAPGVLAAGDAVLADNAAAGRRLPVAHWGEAQAMGEIAGATAAGASRSWDAVPGFWSVLGQRILKHVAWGDGFDEVRLVEHPAGGFTAWQGREGALVGALCHDADADYERAPGLIRRAARLDELTG